MLSRLSSASALPTLAATLFAAVSTATGLPSSDLVVGWWGAGWFNDVIQIPQVCADPAYSVVILTFVNIENGWPSILFNAENTGPSAAQTAAGATGLMAMPDMAQQITTCQQNGKKVMLSLGGGSGDVVFDDDDAAISFAYQLWQLFGGDTQTLSDLRPYGDVIIDGFDMDNESGDSTGYTALVSTLRSLMDSDSTKQYYLSGTPQCPQPDQNLPIEALQAMDFVNVQFYNNGDCNHGQAGFMDSVQSWSQSLAGNNSQAQLYIGTICDSREGTGYLSPDQLVAEIARVAALKSQYQLDNLAGYALWDLAEAINNGFDTPVQQAMAANF